MRNDRLQHNNKLLVMTRIKVGYNLAFFKN